MKNLLIISRYFPPVENGLSDHSRMISKLIMNECLSVDIVAEQHEDRRKTHTDFLNIHIHEYRGSKQLFRTISKLCNSGGVDIVLFQYVPHMWGRAGFAPAIALLPLWLKLRFGLPVISYLHEMYYDWSVNPKKSLLAIFHRIQLMLIASASKALIVTNFKREKVLKRFWPKKVYRIPAGNVSGRKSDDIRTNPYDFPYITWFGTLSEDQRLQSLIEAFCMNAQENPALRLILVGGFDIKSPQMSMVRQMGVDYLVDSRIMIRGFVSDDELSDILHGSLANMFIAASGPSGRRGVVGAYIRSGRPIISIIGHETDPEFVDGDNILFVPDQDSEALTKAIGTIIHNKSLRGQLEEGMRELYVNHYSDEIILNKLKYVFTLHSKRGSP